MPHPNPSLPQYALFCACAFVGAAAGVISASVRFDSSLINVVAALGSVAAAGSALWTARLMKAHQSELMTGRPSLELENAPPRAQFNLASAQGLSDHMAIPEWTIRNVGSGPIMDGYAYCRVVEEDRFTYGAVSASSVAQRYFDIDPGLTTLKRAGDPSAGSVTLISPEVSLGWFELAPGSTWTCRCPDELMSWLAVKLLTMGETVRDGEHVARIEVLVSYDSPFKQRSTRILKMEMVAKNVGLVPAGAPTAFGGNLIPALLGSAGQKAAKAETH